MTALVLDASAVVDLLLRNDRGAVVRARMAEHELHTVAHLDAEVFSALARLYRSDELDASAVAARLQLLTLLDVQRVPISGPLLRDAWALRENVTARDALYVALARAFGARLLTTDDKLSRAVPKLAVDLA